MTRKDLRRLAAVVGLLATITVTGCASKAESPRAGLSSQPVSTEASSSAWSSAASNDPIIVTAAAKIRPLLETQYASQFTEVVLKQEPGVVPALEIRRVPGSDIDAFVRSQLPGVAVSFIDTVYSAQRMQQLQNKIVSDSDYWKKHGIVLNSVGPGDAVTYEAEVWTTEGTPAEAAALRDKYGTSAIKVVAHAAPVTDVAKVPPSS